MYPSQTSLIPVTVALARFAEEIVNKQGWFPALGLFKAWYPYWYLGVHYRYLTGPIVPLLIVYLKKVFPASTLFDSSIYLILISHLIGVVGWLVLIKKLQNSKKWSFSGLILGILLLILPWRLFSSLAFSEGSFTVARNILPFVLFAFWGYLKNKDKLSTSLALITTTLILLINTSILPILIVGITSLVSTKSLKNGKINNLNKYIGPSSLVILCSLALVTFWYTPTYWWTILTNPSIGGASGLKVIFRILDLLKANIPLVLAVLVVYFSKKINSRLTVFTLVWNGTFLFLTIFRFVADWDFWMDWSSWFFELEIGLALVVAKKISDLTAKNHEPSMDVKVLRSYVLILVSAFLPFYLVWRTHFALGRPALISRKIPEGVKSLEKLAEITGDERVFLSGSTVFWVNSVYNIYQVRGGRDQVAIHPVWGKAAYEFREGESPERTRDYLDKLGVKYVLVHTEQSHEFYHDFNYLGKWSKVGTNVWEKEGDIIYSLIEKSLLWVPVLWGEISADLS